MHASGSELFPDVSIVDCGSADANYEVIARLDDTTDTSGCDRFATTAAAYRAESGHTKYVLCLSARNEN